MREFYDEIIIGAGVIGAATAMQLAVAGHKVLLLERAEPASGASGGNLGQISLADRCEKWHMSLALESLDFYKNTLSTSYNIEYVESGGSLFLLNELQIRLAQQALKDMKALGVDAHIYYGDDVLKVEPHVNKDAIQALLFVPGEGKINPFYTTLALIDRAEKNGADLICQCPVTSFNIENGRITSANTPKGSFKAKHIINAAGPMAWHVADMAGVKVPICFHKGTAFVTEPIADLINGPVVGGGSLVKEGGPIVGGGTTLTQEGGRSPIHIGTGFIQTADGSCILAQATEDCEPDDRSVDAYSFKMIASNCLTYYPQLRDVQVVRAWAACTTFTKDNLPVFGFSKEVQNFFTVAGWKGAFTTAPAIGRKVKEAMEGHMPEDYRLFTPDRETEGYSSSVIDR